ncbi:kinase-like domain-containing protein [Truncatella angustata]|uniref:Kinase-like domain-containing protein n=1 Tax=Truncatella angustata TaxID=152316 RepID=A0A9P8UE24_9PEZI|nr:kinase-like domain-containing protein [Truncatella angustata]KAH6648208.1 kinase-like domain-containing protein [Truncatella angustata]
MPTRSPSWWTPPKASLPPPHGDVPSSVIFPPQPPSAAGARLGSGILTIKLHSATRVGSLSCPEEIDQWPIYALLECESFQLSARAAWWGGKRGSALWRETFHFDVTKSPELVVYLSTRNHNAPEGSRIEPRGRFTITSLPDGYPVGRLLADIQDGTGQVELIVSYLQQKVPALEDRNVWELLGMDHVNFVHVTKRDTGRTYAMTVVQLRTANAIPEAEKANDLGSSICHPFIAPLKFAFASGRRLSLLSPLASGGHLFYHLQRERRFDGDKAKLYAAELILVLEYLHNKNIIFALLDPAHILLDTYGHISLCHPAIYSKGLPISGAIDCILSASLEYTAPELLVHHEATQAVDWWMLGVMLYEMLTGLPSFYHKDVEEQRRRIISQTLQLPLGLPSDASDILAALLIKDPLQRLGANGASEVKDHAFFHGLDWQRLLQREYTTPFQPDNTSTVFKLKPIERDMHKRPARRLSRGTVYEHREDLAGFGFPSVWQPIGHEVAESEHVALDNASPQLNDSAWELTWNPISASLYFTHQLTGEERSAEIQPLTGPPTTDGHTVAAAAPIESGPVAHSLPNTKQLQNALAVALKTGHGSNVVLQIIKYGMNLNIPILHYDHVPDDTGIMFDLKDEIPVTPLEWATEHNRLDLVNLFLLNGADPNYTCHEIEGPALVRAVHRKSQLVQLLVEKTNRVSSTRALCAAVDRQDAAIVETLLASGVRCEFEEADLASPLKMTNYDNALYANASPRLEAVDLLAPLVRAVRLGNTGLVRLLLAHGADANVGYHCDSGGSLPLPRRQHGWDYQRAEAVPRKVNFSCGRAAQLAMELGHDEIVRLLMASGADVRLPQPVWAVQGHTCPLVPRAVWLEVTAGLEELRVVIEKKA